MDMDRETQARILREQRAGYDALHKLEVEEWRRATFADRLRDFEIVLRSATVMPDRPRPLWDEAIIERWLRIRRAHE